MHRTPESPTPSDTPLISIGLPVYNSERYLRQSLDSLLAQTYRDFVLVINDNASTDGTAAICQEYAAKDARVKYFRNDTNIGNPRNFNRVFSLTNSKYLKWSTADDFWAPTFLEKALEIMESDSSIALCYPRAAIVDADGQNAQPYEDVLHSMDDDPVARFIGLMSRIRLAHQHLGLIRTSFLKQTHLLGTYPGSDIKLLAELTLYGKIYELPEILYFRRFHKTSGSWNRKDIKHQVAHYLGAHDRPKLISWQNHIGFFAVVLRAPLSVRQKAKLATYLARCVRWDAGELIGELKRYFRHVFRFVPSR